MNIREWQKMQETVAKNWGNYQLLPVVTRSRINFFGERGFFQRAEEKVSPTEKKVEKSGSDWLRRVTSGDDVISQRSPPENSYDAAEWVGSPYPSTDSLLNRRKTSRMEGSFYSHPEYRGLADVWNYEQFSECELPFQRSGNQGEVLPDSTPQHPCNFLGKRVRFHCLSDDREIIGRVIEQKYVGRFHPGNIPEFVLTVRDAIGKCHRAQFVRDSARILDDEN